MQSKQGRTCVVMRTVVLQTRRPITPSCGESKLCHSRTIIPLSLQTKSTGRFTGLPSFAVSRKMTGLANSHVAAMSVHVAAMSVWQTAMLNCTAGPGWGVLPCEEHMFSYKAYMHNMNIYIYRQPGSNCHHQQITAASKHAHGKPISRTNGRFHCVYSCTTAPRRIGCNRHPLYLTGEACAPLATACRLFRRTMHVHMNACIHEQHDRHPVRQLAHHHSNPATAAPW